jgi:hypothetical protein
MIRKPLPQLIRAVLAGAGLALAACTTQADLAKAQLAALSVQLPGNYGNAQQLLTILPLSAPLVGDNVLYVRETAANDVHRVISERIWSLQVAADNHILGSVYLFEEPERWRGGAESPELFRSLLLRDLQPVPGCDLVWHKSERGFSAAAVSARCPQRWRLEGDELAFSERGGAAAPPESYFHFARIQ